MDSILVREALMRWYLLHGEKAVVLSLDDIEDRWAKELWYDNWLRDLTPNRRSIKLKITAKALRLIKS